MTIGDNSSSANCKSSELRATIGELLDSRNIPIYVIIQNSEEVTSRWTRADAERELERLYAHEAQLRAPRSAGLNTIRNDQIEIVARR